MYSKIILAIPHAYGNADVKKWSSPKVREDIIRWTDWKTDILFMQTGCPVTAVISLVNRFDCDCERLKCDPLEAEGQGILYTRSHSGYTRTRTNNEENSAYMAIYNDYHKKIRDEVMGPGTLIIDCHSFPENIADIDICLGFNEDVSNDHETIRIARDHFSAHGYIVGLNAPYANSLVEGEAKSMLIEVNKRVYLTKRNTMKNRARKLGFVLDELYKRFLSSVPDSMPD